MTLTVQNSLCRCVYFDTDQPPLCLNDASSRGQNKARNMQAFVPDFSISSSCSIGTTLTLINKQNVHRITCQRNTPTGEIELPKGIGEGAQRDRRISCWSKNPWPCSPPAAAISHYLLLQQLLLGLLSRSSCPPTCSPAAAVAGFWSPAICLFNNPWEIEQ
jgi:hypothetical protein